MIIIAINVAITASHTIGSVDAIIAVDGDPITKVSISMSVMITFNVASVNSVIVTNIAISIDVRVTFYDIMIDHVPITCV
jgi:hypothetical protein